MSIFKKLFGSSDQPETTNIWLDLPEDANLEELMSKSGELPVLIFKHSTRCTISAMAKNRLERDWPTLNGKLLPYLVYVVEQRILSNAIENKFHVVHQSPQAILLNKGKVVYHDSHTSIQGRAILNAIEPGV